MRKYLLIIFSISVLTSVRCFSQGINQDNKLRQIIHQLGQSEVTIPYSEIKSIDSLTRKVSILNIGNKEVHLSISPKTVKWFILQNFDYKIIDRAETKSVISASDLNQVMDWDKYPTYPQYDSIMQSFVNQYPSLCHLDTIGTSVNGRLVLALKISDNAGINEDEPEVFYTSTIHGDETGGFVLMLRLADYLLKKYNINSRVKNLVDNLQIWINPLANPDGTYRSGNTITSPTRYNANGVDLNRNFPDPFQPFEIQERENRDMITFMRKHNFVISANFHSGVEVVNYPWDRWLSKLHADDEWFHNISRAYADTVHYYSGPSYMNYLNNGITRGAEWYIIYGGRQDFVTYELQGREVTIELDDQYITPAAQLPLLWQHNLHSFLGYLENSIYSIHGHIFNATTTAPLKAEVFINGHDKDSSQVYSDSLTGSFVRMLASGSWNLTFKATGYYDYTISNIFVFPSQRMDFTVNLIPKTNSIDTTSPESPFIYPNPASNEFNAVLPDLINGAINVKIVNMMGSIISDYNIEAVQNMPVKIDVESLAAGTYTVLFTNRSTKINSRARFMVIK